jgi:hypothetical protein
MPHLVIGLPNHWIPAVLILAQSAHHCFSLLFLVLAVARETRLEQSGRTIPEID